MWEADRELSGTGAVGGFEWTAGTHHETRELSVTFPAGGAAEVTVRSLPEWRSKYVHLTMRRGRKIAKVAMAPKLAVCLYWMMRKQWDYEQLKKFGSHAGQPGNRDGVKQNIE